MGLSTANKEMKFLKHWGRARASWKSSAVKAGSVISPRSNNFTSLNWSLKDQEEIVHQGAFHDSDPRKEFLLHVQECFGSRFASSTFQISSGISSSLQNGTPGPSFRRGDVVETLCCRASGPSFHFPFVVQQNCSSFLEDLSAHSYLSLWCIEDVLAMKKPDRNTDFYLSVLPCSTRDENSFSQNITQSVKMYSVLPQEKVSFAKIDCSMRKVGVIHECSRGFCSRNDPDNRCQPISTGTPFLHFLEKQDFLQDRVRKPRLG